MSTTATPADDSSAPQVSFWRKFRQHGMQVAMLRPASPSLALAHCAYVTPERPQVIVELGAGTGPVTAALAARMHPDSRLLALEIDPDFAAVLRARCPRAEVLVEDAGNLVDIAVRHELDRIDLMVCCLALPYIPRRAVAGIFGAFAALGVKGCFTQQTLVPLVYRRMYTRLFEQVQFRPVVRNLPPGGVYHCHGLRTTYRDHLPRQTLTGETHGQCITDDEERCLRASLTSRSPGISCRSRHETSPTPPDDCLGLAHLRRLCALDSLQKKAAPVKSSSPIPEQSIRTTFAFGPMPMIRRAAW